MERRQFTREFKLEAVRLIKDRGVSYVQASAVKPGTIGWRTSGRSASRQICSTRASAEARRPSAPLTSATRPSLRRMRRSEVVPVV